ncbi:hypothetical protein B0J13DRAFT_566968 [Dactylonectria estremocensis]|uniref:C2H2-type domain-containing protein n=1 Tax=Dactylonectria estremocensis TaxID=1079267 RepID=A0A9P9DNE0_9HYPO|nr:hypothetical protein B0J13DRAFT_566968 [Dactylonectria estremocensis]
MKNDSDPRISPLAIQCDKLFVTYLENIQLLSTNESYGEFSRSVEQLAKDSQARFTAWSSYMGVHADRPMSLDSRLSNKSEICIMVTKLLEVLHRNLQGLTQTLPRNHPSQVPRESTSHEKFPGPTPEFLTQYQQHQQSIEGSITRLHRLGVAIRRSSTGSLLSRVKAFSAKRVDLPLEELYSHCVKYLYPLAADSLQTHIIQSMLERHFRLAYQQEHQNRISQPPVLSERRNEDTLFTTPEAALAMEIEVPTNIPDRVRVSRNDTRNKVEEHMTQKDSSLGTKPSTLNTQAFRQMLDAVERAPATTSSPVSSAAPDRIQYPRPPKAAGRGTEFICTWCSVSLPVDSHSRRSRQWRRHVDYDLKPFICLAENCSATDTAFGKRQLWIDHMKSNHSTQWARHVHREPQLKCDIDHPRPLSFDRKTDLLSHMNESHSDAYTTAQISSIVRRSFRYVTRPEGICPFRCSYDAAKDPTVQKLWADQAVMEISNDDPQEMKIQNTRKRRHLESNNQAKRPRVVRFAIQAPESTGDLGDNDTTESSNLEEVKKMGPVDRRDVILQEALSRHVAMHLTLLSFLTLRLKEVQEQNEEQEDDGSTSQEDSDETGDIYEAKDRDSDLDDMSLTFDEAPDRQDGYEYDELRHELAPELETALGQPSSWKFLDMNRLAKSISTNSRASSHVLDASFNKSPKEPELLFSWRFPVTAYDIPQFKDPRVNQHGSWDLIQASCRSIIDGSDGALLEDVPPRTELEYSRIPNEDPLSRLEFPDSRPSDLRELSVSHEIFRFNAGFNAEPMELEYSLIPNEDLMPRLELPDYWPSDFREASVSHQIFGFGAGFDTEPIDSSNVGNAEDLDSV